VEEVKHYIQLKHKTPSITFELSRLKGHSGRGWKIRPVNPHGQLSPFRTCLRKKAAP